MDHDEGAAKAMLDDLMGEYLRFLALCYDAMAPEAPQSQRDHLREAIRTYAEQWHSRESKN